jgi:Tfp pilus assembly ATPase PilU
MNLAYRSGRARFLQHLPAADSVGLVIRQIKLNVPASTTSASGRTEGHLARKRGLVLVTGATGSENRDSYSDDRHEHDHRTCSRSDPIEFVHRHKVIVTARGRLRALLHERCATARHRHDPVRRVRDRSPWTTIAFRKPAISASYAPLERANQTIGGSSASSRPRAAADLLELSLNLRGIISQRLILEPAGGASSRWRFCSTPARQGPDQEAEIDTLKEALGKARTRAVDVRRIALPPCA